MKKQMYRFEKYDWFVTIYKKYIPAVFTYEFSTLVKAKNYIRKQACHGDEVQIFKVSYEFRDAFVVGENKRKATKGKKK